MSTGFTIPMARALLADGRARDVTRMLEPLLEGREASASERLSLRCLLSRIYLLENRDVASADDLLRHLPDTASPSDLDDATRAEAELWLGWADLLSGVEVRRPKAAVHLARAHALARPAETPDTLLWALIGRATLLASPGASGAAAYLAARARRLHSAGDAGPVSRWLKTLPGEAPLPSDPLPGHVWFSEAMAVLARAANAATTKPLPLLIHGEKGSGRRHLARAMNRLAGRGEDCFFLCKCGAAQEEELEQQLDRMLSVDDAATFCFHDVDQMPLTVQKRLIEAIRDPGHASDRFAFTSTLSFTELADEDFIAEPLLAHLALFQLTVPPLRRRPEDVGLLVSHFLRAFRRPQHTPAAITDEALCLLTRYTWPGNVRQLRNELERALVHVQSEPAQLVRVETLSEVLRAGAVAGSDAMRGDVGDLDDILARTEKAVIESVLAQTGGQVSTSAEALGLTRQGLYKKMKRLGIEAAKHQMQDHQPEVALQDQSEVTYA